MLVLSRKVGETIHIGDDILLEVRRIAGNRVTLALKAPRQVRILRGELEKSASDFDDPPDEENSTAEHPNPILVDQQSIASLATFVEAEPSGNYIH